jgi:hypothetical protein
MPRRITPVPRPQHQACTITVTVDGGIAPSTPGSRARLLPLSPLRTARASFPACRSSLANAPCGTRWCHVLLSHHLHHTRLEPPGREPVGECTSQCRHCRHLPSLLRRLVKLSGDARPDGRQRAFAWSHIARGRTSYPLHYRVAFASSILPCPHAYRLALRLTFPHGRRTGLPCSVSVTTNGVGALCPPVAWDAHDKEARSPCTRYSAPLAQAWQHLWLVFCDDVYRAFTWVRHTIHPSPSPPDAGRYALPSRCRRQSRDCGFIVRRLCTSRYLHWVGTGRVA